MIIPDISRTFEPDVIMTKSVKRGISCGDVPW